VIDRLPGRPASRRIHRSFTGASHQADTPGGEGPPAMKENIVIPIKIERVKVWGRRTLEAATWLICLGLLAMSAAVAACGALARLVSGSETVLAAGLGCGVLLGLAGVWQLLRRIDQAAKRLRSKAAGAASDPAAPSFINTKIFSVTVWVGILALCAAPSAVWAGPPFVTDDPEPVEYQHWELYVSSQHAESSGDWSGTAPHIEVNYGVFPNVQLHLIAPLAYDSPSDGESHYGYGDTEFGFKLRMIQETDSMPQVGIFPLLEIPTGRESAGLGSGQVQAILPLWLQKSIGDWTIYGGGGYGINPGPGNENWGFGGLVVQRKITEDILLGAELYHRTAMETGGDRDTSFNVGMVIDFTAHHHLLFSAGRSIDGPADFQAYIGYQLTFGPEVFHSVGHRYGHK